MSTVHVTMKRFRHRRLRSRFAFLALLALLWTQLALASHPACSVSSMILSASHAGLDHPGEPALDSCHSSPESEPSILCESHCSQGDLSPEASRTLSVPAIGPMPFPLVLCDQRRPDPPEAAISAGPLHSWHRPTAHPASLLLI